MIKEQYPWNVPLINDDPNTWRYRVSMYLYEMASQAGGSPGLRSWGTFQQTVAAGGGYTSLTAFTAKTVTVRNDSGVTINISQDGTNFYRLITATSKDIAVKESTAEILVKTNAGGSAVTLDIYYAT